MTNNNIPIDTISFDNHVLSEKIVSHLKASNITTISDLNGKTEKEIKAVFSDHPRWFNTFWSHIYRVGIVTKDAVISITPNAWHNFQYNAMKQSYSKRSTL
jgi:hypothetical protein